MRLPRALGAGLAVLLGLFVLGEVVARAAAGSPRAAAIGAVLWLGAVPLAVAAAVIAGRRGPTGPRAAGEPSAPSVAGRLALAGGAVGLAAMVGALAYPRLAPARPPESAAAETAGCRLRFELRVLRTAIPEVVGDCVENAHRDPVSGDTVQRTTGGLLVLRQSDRRAAFTDGARTWVQGPEGIASRPNEERFAWEPAPATATPPPAAAPPPPAPVTAAPPTPLPAATKPAAAPLPPTATPRPIVVTGSGAAPAPPPPTATTGPASDAIMDAVLIGYLRRSGLPLTDIRALTPANDPEGLLGRPGGPISRVVFRDQRTPNAEQSMEMFADAAAVQARVARLGDPGQSHQAFTSPGARTVLRLSKGMPADQLRSYERWLQSLR